MDSVTQVVLGGAITHAMVGKELGRRAFLIGGVLGFLPDLDVLIDYGNDLDNFIYHRGFTHSLFILSLFSIALTLVVDTLSKNSRWRQGLSRSRLFFALYLPLVTHPLLDSFTVYGTQLFWPFFTSLDGRSPESWSTIFIIDPLFTLPLLLSLCIILFTPLRTRVSAVALGISSVYLAWSLCAKIIVDHKAKAVAQEKFGQDITYVSLAAPFTTFLWRVVVMDRQNYHVSYISMLDYGRPLEFETYPHNHTMSASVAQEHIDKIRWFSHGFYKLEKRDELIIASDLRMGVEGAYVFSFVFAREQNKKLTPSSGMQKTPPYQLEQDIDLSRVKKVYEQF